MGPMQLQLKRAYCVKDIQERLLSASIGAVANIF